MFRFRILLCSIPICLLPSTTLAHAPGPLRTRPQSTRLSRHAGLVAVADFSGADRELGHFLTETVETELARSRTIATVPHDEVVQALRELNLSATSGAPSAQLRRLGKRLGVGLLIAGSYLVRDETLYINARMLDLRTGATEPGGAGNVSGSRNDLLELSTRLARQLHRRLTGQDLPQEEEEPTERPADNVRPPSAAPPEEDDFAALRESGLVPPSVRLSAPVTVRDLSALLKRLHQALGGTEAPAGLSGSGPLTRVRALAALVKTVVSPDQIRDIDTDAIRLPRDSDRLPPWARPYVAVAVAERWLAEDRPLRPQEPAVWGFVAGLLARMPVDGNRNNEPDEEDSGGVPYRDRGPARAYTGLLIDARGFRIQRAMGARILDEDGRVLYPDGQRMPGMDYLQDHGTAAYYHLASQAKRAGRHPLIVRPIEVPEPGHDDIIVSRETADRIRAANRRHKFLNRLSVAILLDEGD